jgi:outer membrane protein OmpA-like peptidoglycan-associated protein
VTVSFIKRAIVLCLALGSSGCGILQSNGGPRPGPDRQAEGSLEGAVAGAGAGAVTGFQIGSGTGPGALVGAGLGAVAGGIQGAMQDSFDEQLLKLSAQARAERERVYAQEILEDQFKRRLQLHPTRDIYPADLFFRGDETSLRPTARALVRELARLNKDRASWSRLVVASYVKSASPDPTSQGSEFAQRLAERRAREIVDELVRSGIEPRRLQTRSILTNAPLVIDPLDRPERFNQAVELIALDR